MVAENLGGGNKIGYREDLSESLPMLEGDYFWLAHYSEGVIKRWLSDLGVAYRGPEVETVSDEQLIPDRVAMRFYNQPIKPAQTPTAG